MDVIIDNLHVITETVDLISSKVDSLIPSPLPVPGVITTAATFLSEKATSRYFPYHIRNVNLGDVVLWQAMIIILIHPLIWNVIGRFEYYTRLLSKVFLKPVFGVYAFALWIVVVGTYRDACFVAAMQSQPTAESLGRPEYIGAACALMILGVVLVLTSFYQLGVTGTYLGDYFGILLQNRITAFPFSYFSDPMYDGSTMIFMSKAILSKSPAGMFMAGWVYLVYRLACLIEGPFTAMIYANKDSAKKSN